MTHPASNLSPHRTFRPDIRNLTRSQLSDLLVPLQGARERYHEFVPTIVRLPESSRIPIRRLCVVSDPNPALRVARPLYRVAHLESELQQTPRHVNPGVDKRAFMQLYAFV